MLDVALLQAPLLEGRGGHLPLSGALQEPKDQAEPQKHSTRTSALRSRAASSTQTRSSAAERHNWGASGHLLALACWGRHAAADPLPGHQQHSRRRRLHTWH
jgi:hypothetical protein